MFTNVTRSTDRLPVLTDFPYSDVTADGTVKPTLIRRATKRDEPRPAVNDRAKFLRCAGYVSAFAACGVV